MNKQIEQVKQFSEATVRPDAKLSPFNFHKMLGNIQLEEAKELVKAIEERNEVEIADAVVDNIYVAIYVANAYGFQEKLVELFDAVQKSNMTKVNPDTGKVVYREDGKILKGPFYISPTEDIKRILGVS